MARRQREVLLKYDQGFCVPHDFQHDETAEQWRTRNPSTKNRPDNKLAPWQDFNKPTSLITPNVYQGRQIDFSSKDTSALPDRTIRFRRSYDK